MFIDHLYSYEPETSAVAVEDPLFKALNSVVPGPDVCDQVPVPKAGVFPPNAVEANVPHKFWVLPTLAEEGALETVTVKVKSSIRQLALPAVGLPEPL